MADFLHRAKIIRICVIVVLFALMGRVCYLSLYMGEELAEASVASHVLSAELGYVRGDIYDRNGQCITNQMHSRWVAVFPSLTEREDVAIDELVRLTGRSREAIEEYYKKGMPFCLAVADESLSAKQAGIFLFERSHRYDDSQLASHIIGYTIDEGRTGVGGVEEIYQDILSSDKRECLQVVTDGAGMVIGGLPCGMTGDRTKDVMTTLDWKLQQKIERIADVHGMRGAIVVMTVDGEVLAMVSRPSYRTREIADSLTREDAPLVNRAIMPVAVGSVFKIVTALAGLESGMVDESDIWEDNGRIEVAGITFHGWDDSTDYMPRQRTLREAMAHSSNSVMIQIGMQVGAARIVEMAKRLGFGIPTIDGLTEEGAGNLPNTDGLYIAEVANLAIGQGELLATPMQVTKMMATVANGGYEVTVRLNKEELVREPKRLISRKSAHILDDMLAYAVDCGTGQSAQENIGEVAGKTGSAETGRLTADGKSVCHAWFSGYFPREKPQYVCTVLVEDGGSGGGVAAPIFREIMEIIR